MQVATLPFTRHTTILPYPDFVLNNNRAPPHPGRRNPCLFLCRFTRILLQPIRLDTHRAGVESEVATKGAEPADRGVRSDNGYGQQVTQEPTFFVLGETLIRSCASAGPTPATAAIRDDPGETADYACGTGGCTAVLRGGGVGYCVLASYVNRHPKRRQCPIDRTRRSGTCPEYRARADAQAPSYCRTRSCAHYYQEDWRGRCRLGLKWTGRVGGCSRYQRWSRFPRQPRVGTCSLSSCTFWYRSEEGRYRCRLGLSRRSGQEFPRYEPKRSA